jgi:RND family efflux transporter MFP subunit
VRAPFDGLVVHKDAEIGEVVAATGAGGNSRGSVATIVDLKTLEVQVELSETRLGTIAQGDETRIVLDAAPDQAWRGRVRQVWPTADRQKATVELRIEFLEWPPIVKPEMGARVTFLGKDAGGARTAPSKAKVPRRAVATVGQATAVFVVSAGRVRRVEVVLGAEAAGLVDVERGLVGGEQVVLDPPASLADGAAVRVPTKK